MAGTVAGSVQRCCACHHQLSWTLDICAPSPVLCAPPAATLQLPECATGDNLSCPTGCTCPAAKPVCNNGQCQVRGYPASTLGIAQRQPAPGFVRVGQQRGYTTVDRAHAAASMTDALPHSAQRPFSSAGRPFLATPGAGSWAAHLPDRRWAQVPHPVSLRGRQDLRRGRVQGGQGWQRLDRWRGVVGNGGWV